MLPLCAAMLISLVHTFLPCILLFYTSYSAMPFAAPACSLADKLKADGWPVLPAHRLLPSQLANAQGWAASLELWADQQVGLLAWGCSHGNSLHGLGCIVALTSHLPWLHRKFSLSCLHQHNPGD